MSRPLAALYADLAAAEQARDDLLLSDDHCMVNGVWNSAQAHVLACQRAIVAAQQAAITTDIATRAAELARIEPHARDAMAAGESA